MRCADVKGERYASGSPAKSSRHRTDLHKIRATLLPMLRQYGCGESFTV